MTQLIKKYLLIGGLPDAVNAYINNHNIHEVRDIQREIFEYYGNDASKYDLNNKLKIKRIYDLIPSTLENKKKRIVVKNINNKRWETMKNYQDEFDYLISSGVALEVKATTLPSFPLTQSMSKNLLKLYLNDVGLLSNIYFNENISTVLNDENSINLGTLYETSVAIELKAHGFNLFYYDNKKNGEVDYLIDDYNDLAIVPIEVKSGKDYSIHSALNNLLKCQDYHIKKAYVLSNNREIKIENKIIYMPVYFVMFIKK